MPEDTTFRRGERVVHPRRPEWGVGQVYDAALIQHEGRAAQRVTVTFPNRGRVVLNTAIAPLQHEAAKPPPTPQTTPQTTQEALTSMNAAQRSTSSDGGWLAALERNGKPKGSELWALPPAFSDPFVSDAQRLQHVLDSFRFGLDARSLIDWAVAQTGLDDPLTKYTRHELEQGYQHYARDRELHLREMVRQMKRQGQQLVLDQAMSRCRVAEARQALSRAMRA